MVARRNSASSDTADLSRVRRAPPAHPVRSRVPDACPPAARCVTATAGSPRRSPEPKNANASRMPNTTCTTTSNGWLAILNVVNNSRASTWKFTRYSSSPYSTPASATVPLVRSQRTTRPNATPNAADSTRCTTAPSGGLVVPLPIAASPSTIVEIIRSGSTAGPPVEATNHIVVAANTTPDTTPPTTPRTTRPASGSGATSASAEDTTRHLLTSLHPTHYRRHPRPRDCMTRRRPRGYPAVLARPGQRLELAVPA